MTILGDATFNSGTSCLGQNLTDFVNNGTIAASRMEDMILVDNDADFALNSPNFFSDRSGVDDVLAMC